MIDKPFDDIEFSDLERLVENAVAESQAIEYKSELPGDTDAAKKEFLADVSAFANTSGGDLLYGITEKDGVAAAVDGVKIADPDAAILKYENIIRTGIEPRISVRMKGIATSEKKTVLLIRVEKSWLSPHRVVYKGHDKFYARNSGGKYSLDTQQLREAFNLSQTVVERMKEFRTGRIFEISAGNPPVKLAAGVKAVLHFLPLGAFSPGQHIEVREMMEHHIDQPNLGGLRSIIPLPAINFDGVLYRDDGLRQDANKTPRRYIQIFRNGIIESVFSTSWTENQIPNCKFAKSMCHFLYCSMNFAGKFDVSPPAFVCLTLVDAKDCQILGSSDGPFSNSPTGKIDRDILQMPEKMISSYDVNPLDVLSPMFDIVWQACGDPGMPDSEKKRL